MRTALVTGGFALLVVSTTAIQGISQDHTPARQKAQASLGREALKPRDAEERALAAYFASYRDSSPPMKAGDIVGIGPIESAPPPPTAQQDFAELKAAVCQAEAIVSGRATPSRVFFNAGETFLITTYVVRSDQWLRPLDPTRQPPEVRVALPGGQVMVDGKLTRAMGPAQLKPSQAVVLWLRKVKGTSTYVLAPEVGVLSFEGKAIHTAYPTRIAILRAPESRSNVFTAITNASAICGG
jgi:hypothetical protein